jgi:hypothetical protein
MKTSFVIVALVLALACVATAQPPRRNATEELTPTGRRNATAVAGAVRNATASAVAARRNATANGTMAANATTGMGAADAPTTAPKASPAPEAKKSSASVATTGFAAAVAGSVLLLQLVL